jgi:two-component system LytT family sensor kinase
MGCALPPDPRSFMPSEDTVRDPSARSTRASWMLYVLFAVLLGMYQGVNQMIDNSQIAPWKPLLWEMSSALMFVACIPLIIRFERRFRLDGRPWWRTLLAHGCGVLTFCALHVAGMVAIRKSIYALMGERYDFGDPFVRSFYELQKDLITYAAVLVAIFAYRLFQVRRDGETQAARLAAELSQARLSHLTAQIEPHFLFNALNAISNRMHEDVDAADRMISDLGALLRAAYACDNQALVPLASELEWLRGYTAMMSERFRGQLSFQLNVQAGLEAVAVPRLLLQPLVENALKHGLADGHGSLTVEVERHGSSLRYRVSDDGVGVGAQPVRAGTGLSNVQRRLQLLFPGAHDFDLKPRQPRGTLATLSFPAAF